MLGKAKVWSLELAHSCAAAPILAKGLWRSGARAAQDLVFPHHALDGAGRSLSAGLSPEAWARTRFLEAPVCDGCG
ncbi:MAG TPA: hypothetical protein VMU59_15460 [Caulobacteraceae bacterium]|nr:hypothetical protein [Caulobacteraceae bacterium]